MIRLLAAALGISILWSANGCDFRKGADGQPRAAQSLAATAAGDADVEVAGRMMEQKQFADALPLLKQALEKRRVVYSRSLVLTMIGNCYNELEEFDKSLAYHDKAILEDPQNYKAYVNKGIVYRLLQEYGKAEECYSKALKLAPDYAELHASMGALAVFQGKYDAAVRHLERAVELDDSLPVAHSNLALAYATVGRFEDADKELRAAVVRGYHQPDLIRKRIEELRKLSEAGKTDQNESAGQTVRDSK